MDNFSASTKGLSSCVADLKVTVGRTTSIRTSGTTAGISDDNNKNESSSSTYGRSDSDSDDEVVCFMYPKTILANASEYVDTILSSSVPPMKEEKGETYYTISFSDIQPEHWFKWTNFVLHPVCACEMDPFDDDAVEMLKFYEKYQFRSGIHLFDYKLSRSIKSIPTTIKKVDHRLCRKIIFYMVEMISSKDNNNAAGVVVDLPLTKNVLPIFVIEQFNMGSLDCAKMSGEEIRSFLPYMFVGNNSADDDDFEQRTPTHLEDMADIVSGAQINERSLEDLKLILYESSFPSTLQTKLLGTKQLTYVLDSLQINEIYIKAGRGSKNAFRIRGHYRRNQRYDKRLGVMQNWYSMNRYEFTFVVQSLDGLGSTWTISVHLRKTPDNKRCGSNIIGPTAGGGTSTGAAGAATLLYMWHKGDNITSIVPPMDGWEDIGVSEDFVQVDNDDEPVDEPLDVQSNNDDSNHADEYENTDQSPIRISYKINE